MIHSARVLNYRFYNSSPGSVDVHIDGEIIDASTQEVYRNWFGDDTSVSFKSLRDQLDGSGADVFNIYINCPGGQVMEAMAFHDYLIHLRQKGKKVNTYGRGLIASAATYILMAGDLPEMSRNSWFMIHNVSGRASGEVNEIEQTAATLRQFNNAIRDFYSTATGIPKEEIEEMMNNETWMTAEAAFNKGFIKKISGDASFTNKLATENWNYSNVDVLNAYNSFVSPSGDITRLCQLTHNTEMKTFFQNIINTIRTTKPEPGTDPASLANHIANAITEPFNQLGDQLENRISELVHNVVSSAIKDFKAENDAKMSDIVANNSALQEELAIVKGRPTNTGQDISQSPVIGAFR